LTRGIRAALDQALDDLALAMALDKPAPLA